MCKSMGQDCEYIPAVPPKLTEIRPLMFRTTIRLAFITGAKPVDCYSSFGSFGRPHKSIHKSYTCRAFTTADSLKGKIFRYLLLIIGLILINWILSP